MRENSSLSLNLAHPLIIGNPILHMSPAWFIYMIRTASGTLYTGITTNVDRRLEEHSQGKRGAKSLRGKGPLALVFSLPVKNRSEASILEARVKKLTRSEKEMLVAGNKALLRSLQS